VLFAVRHLAFQPSIHMKPVARPDVRLFSLRIVRSFAISTGVAQALGVGTTEKVAPGTIAVLVTRKK